MKTMNLTHQRGSLMLSSIPKNSTKHFLLGSFIMALTFLLVSCASFSVLKPGKSATVTSPLTLDLYWDANLQPGTIKAVIDAASSPTDVTSQLMIPSTSANSHATAQLFLSQGPHTIDISGNLSVSGDYKPRRISQSFLVSNTIGRPVTYTETIFNYSPGWPSGKLGDLSFGGTSANPNVILIFTFEGNTHDVVPFNVKTTKKAVQDGVGWMIMSGTASVAIQDALTKQTLAQGTFVPGAGVFVSVDNGNSGIGFGSFGVLPTDPSFPPPGFEPLYPFAMTIPPKTTDLVSNFIASSIWALSCAGFSGSPGTLDPNGTCNLPEPLGTTSGILLINSNSPQVEVSGEIQATFTTVVH